MQFHHPTKLPTYSSPVAPSSARGDDEMSVPCWATERRKVGGGGNSVEEDANSSSSAAA